MRLIKNRKACSGNLGNIALGQMKNVKIILHVSSDLEQFSPNCPPAHAIISTNRCWLEIPGLIFDVNFDNAAKHEGLETQKRLKIQKCNCV